mmetsp:Transcript_3659/g.4164  ORF Transcript_3659/g.4164 Transcript_3659/m.4164 type:complete len:236 (-) Transcript_3659:315-1022(-)
MSETIHPFVMMALMIMSYVVVPGTSFPTPCYSTVNSVLLQIQHYHYPRPYYHASNPNSSGNDETTADPEFVLLAEEQRLDSLKDTEEASDTTIVPAFLSEAISSNENLNLLFVPLINSFLSIRKELYARIRDVLTNLITIITRSLTKTTNWVRDDAAGQLVSSALGLVTFFIAVGLFAAWNIQILGGKKWSGPAEVIVPTIRVPTSTVVEGGIKVQRANWKRPIIQTSYEIPDDG